MKAAMEKTITHKIIIIIRHIDKESERRVRDKQNNHGGLTKKARDGSETNRTIMAD